MTISSDKSEEIRRAFVHTMAGRAKAGWNDDDCSRRGAYEARVAAKREGERTARLVEAEAELRDERAHSKRWQQIAIVLVIVIIVILVSHPYLIGLQHRIHQSSRSSRSFVIPSPRRGDSSWLVGDRDRRRPRAAPWASYPSSPTRDTLLGWLGCRLPTR